MDEKGIKKAQEGWARVQKDLEKSPEKDVMNVVNHFVEPRWWQMTGLLFKEIGKKLLFWRRW